MLLTHPDQFQAWQAPDSQTRFLQHLVTHRRAVIDERTALTNRLQGLLKTYFPQALELCGEELWRPLATALLLKWPTLTAIQKASPQKVKEFYHLQGSRSQKLIEQRLERIKDAVAVTDEPAFNQTLALRVQRVASASVCDEGKGDGVECCAKSNEHYDQSKARRVGGKD